MRTIKIEIIANIRFVIPAVHCQKHMLIIPALTNT